jgi:hypothetical protein
MRLNKRLFAVAILLICSLCASAMANHIYVGTTELDKFKRSEHDGIFMPPPDAYSDYPGGIFAFRGDTSRQNAAFGMADILLNEMEVLWQVPVKDGFGPASQPLIVKWAKEIREEMNIYDDMKYTSALREVIVSDLGGVVHFLNLKDGLPTRDAIDLGTASNGNISLYPSATNAILSVDESLFELFTQKKLPLSIDGMTSPIFDRTSDNMIVTGTDGALYTIKLNSEFDYHAMSVTAEPDTAIRFVPENGPSATAPGNVAMVSSSAFYTDKHGIMNIVDANTMVGIFSFPLDSRAHIALDFEFEDENTWAIYAADSSCVYRIDGATIHTYWKTPYANVIGFIPAPIVGQQSIGDRVIFTLGNAVTAFDKKAGAIVWQTPLDNPCQSSPVAVYNEGGEAFILQADESGVLYMLAGQSGAVLQSLPLAGDVEASPAVYNDVLVIGTSKYLYGILLK